MALQLKNVINEELDKFLLREYMAVWRDDAITKLSIQIANDFAPLNMKTNINRNKEFNAKYNLFIGNKELPIFVTYKIDGTGWNGVYHSSKKDIVLHLYGKITASKVLSGLYHEITHALDARMEEKLGRDIGYHYGENYIRLNVKSATCDVVNNILYRLWTFTERNAYQSEALFGINFCQSYIKELEEDIHYLETHVNKNEDIIFNELKERLARSNRLAHSNWMAFKRYFIRKSYALLEKFSTKLINNAYKAQQDGLVVTLEPNENSEIFTKFKKENDAVENKLMKARQEQERIYNARVNNATAFLKQFMLVENEEIEKAFNSILEGFKRGSYEYDNGATFDNTPAFGEITVLSKQYCQDLLFSNNDLLEIIPRLGGYNKNYFLIFEDDNGNTFVIDDCRNYQIRINSPIITRILSNIVAKCAVYENTNTFCTVTFNKEKILNELMSKKEEIISTVKNVLSNLYDLLIKHEYTLSIKLKDREVNLSAPTQDELAMKLRNEFPKWSDSVINNWASKAIMA